jgi:hypothetical protein
VNLERPTKDRGSGWDEPTVTTAFTRNLRRVYLTKRLGTGGGSMLGLMRNPGWGGWL